MAEATEASLPPDPAKAKGRITAFDAFRGLAILCVVFGHTTPFGWQFQHDPERQFDFWLAVVERNILLPCLPLFVFLSGYLLGNTRCNSWAEYGSFLGKRVSRVAVPFLFWSIVFMIFSALRVEYTPLEIVTRIVTGRADGAYYFILLIIQFYLLTPVFARILDWRFGIHALLFAHLGYITALYLIQFFHWPTMPYEVAKTPIFGWLSIFPMGMYVRRHPRVIEPFQVRYVLPAFFLFFALTMLESAWLFPKGTFELAISDLRYMPLAMGYSVVILCMKLVDKPWPNALAWLGSISFGIFFIHGFILRRVAELLLTAAPALFDYLLLFQLLAASFTVALCVAVIAPAKRLLPDSIAGRLFGF